MNMPNNHPAAVAASIAMLDHMLDGRLIFGISPGGLLSDAELFGNLDANRNEMFLEAINQVLAIWAYEPPYNIKGKYWTISTERTLMRDIGQGYIPGPLQRPHPPIVVTAVAPFSKGVTEAAVRGWEPISANFLMPAWVKSHWPKYVEGCQRGGRPADPANWRVAKSIFVANDAATAKAYATDPDGPYVGYYRSLYTTLKKNGRIELFKDTAATSRMTKSRWRRSAISSSSTATPDSVADQILAFQEDVSTFRHAALRSEGLERSRAWPPFHDLDGRKGLAAGQCEHGTVKRCRVKSREEKFPTSRIWPLKVSRQQ